MNKKLLFILGFIFAFNSFLAAQKNIVKPAPVTMTAIKAAPEQIDDQEHPYGGTFQIICDKKARKKEVFSTDLLKQIEESRLENEEKILVLSPVTKIRILSRQQISAPNFQPIEKLYSFE